MSHQRLAQLIQAHQGAMLAHPEAQATHEAMISLLRGLDSGEITMAQCVRLLRYQAVLVAEARVHSAHPARCRAADDDHHASHRATRRGGCLAA